jgi:hypothetical protein
MGEAMTDLSEVLARYAGWGEPRVVHEGEDLRLGNTLAPPASASEIGQAWPPGAYPEAAALWSATNGAMLFEDVTYGQWGIKLLSAAESAQRTAEERADRPAELRPDDIVIGEFLGDQELLILAPGESGDRRVLVALPLDKRDEWYGAAPSVADFLDRYYDALGDKYWE